MGNGWQLVGGIGALIFSVALTYWLFVAPSAVRRQRRENARELHDPRAR